jgi:hypothetical protein
MALVFVGKSNPHDGKFFRHERFDGVNRAGGGRLAPVPKSTMAAFDARM